MFGSQRSKYWISIPFGGIIFFLYRLNARHAITPDTYHALLVSVWIAWVIVYGINLWRIWRQ